MPGDPPGTGSKGDKEECVCLCLSDGLHWVGAR